jgi:hypothetical protein
VRPVEAEMDDVNRLDDLADLKSRADFPSELRQ